jgi:hypothetical protein
MAGFQCVACCPLGTSGAEKTPAAILPAADFDDQDERPVDMVRDLVS